MKIALYVHCFFPNYYHGTETYTLSLAKNLLIMGHEPVVVSSVPQGENRTESLITNYDYQGIPVICIDKNYIPSRSILDTYYSPSMYQIHNELLQKIHPDIVHVTHLGNHTAALLDAAAELSIPIVATFTDFFGFCYNSKLEAANGSLCTGPNSKRTNCFTCFIKSGVSRKKIPLGEKIFKKGAQLIQWGSVLFSGIYKMPGLKHSLLSAQYHDIKARPKLLAERYGLYSAVIAPTQFLQLAYEMNGLTEAPFHKINFGVDIDRKPKLLPPSTEPMRFGFIGQIAPHKGTSLLVEAFCRLPKGKSELYIYGADDQFPAYTQAIKARCANFQIFFRGTFQPEQMRQILDGIDFLVIPSTWYENSPLVLLDALASHTPVIVSDVEGLTEFLQQGKNGYAFVRGSVDGLEQVLRQIQENPESSRQLSLTTSFSKTTLDMTEEVEKIYDSIAATKMI